MKRILLVILIVAAFGFMAGCSTTPDGHEGHQQNHPAGNGCH